MTLKVRNKFLKIFFIFSILCILSAILSFVIALINKAITPPPDIRVPKFLSGIRFFSYSFTATMISIMMIVLSVPVIVFRILKSFEMTQSTEIIFFTAFLMGCLCETVRFLTPLFGLWSTFSNLLFFCGRILFMGRLLVPFSFLFASLTNSIEQRQETERNFAILLAISEVFSIVVPLNTAKITSAGAVTWGFSNMFFILRAVSIIIAFISFRRSWRNSNSEEYRKISIFMIVLMAGYSILVCADNFVFLAAGFPLMIYGISGYLMNLHKLYMWQ